MLADFLWPDWLTFDGVLKVLFDGFKKGWEWIRDALWAAVGPLFTALVEGVEGFLEWKTELITNLGTFVDYLAFANAWVPVDLFFTLLVAYVVFALAVLVYRTVKSFLPGIGASGT